MFCFLLSLPAGGRWSCRNTPGQTPVFLYCNSCLLRFCKVYPIGKIRRASMRSALTLLVLSELVLQLFCSIPIEQHLYNFTSFALSWTIFYMAAHLLTSQRWWCSDCVYLCLSQTLWVSEPIFVLFSLSYALSSVICIMRHQIQSVSSTKFLLNRLLLDTCLFIHVSISGWLAC